MREESFDGVALMCDIHTITQECEVVLDFIARIGSIEHIFCIIILSDTPKKLLIAETSRLKRGSRTNSDDN